MKKTRMNNHLIYWVIAATFLLLLFFFLILGGKVSAEAGTMNEMKSYDTVLVKDGDTLSSVASSYAREYSHFSLEDYQEAIISLNNLSSEYIQAGSYLLLPQYR